MRMAPRSVPRAYPQAGQAVVDPITLAFKNALSGVGGIQTAPGASGGTKEIPEAERGMKLEAKCINMRYDKATGLFLTEERKSFTNSSDPYAANVFTLNRTIDDSAPHRAYFDIRSPYLQKIFEEKIGQVEGVSWTSRPLRVDYQLFIIHLKELQEALDNLKSSEPEGDGLKTEGSESTLTRDHLAYFLTFLREEYATTIAELASLLEHGEIKFNLLWAIFKPSMILYTKCMVTDEPRALRLLDASLVSQQNATPYWQMNVVYVDFNLNYSYALSNYLSDFPPKYGLVSGIYPQSVGYFKGTRKITSLSVYPLHFLPQADELRNILITRGKKWASLQGNVHHMQYRKVGSALEHERRLLTPERVIVDREKFGAYPSGQVRQAGTTVATVNKDLDGNALSNLIPPNFNTRADLNMYVMEADMAEVVNVDEAELVDDELLITSPCLYAYNLTTKTWSSIGVDSVEAIEWNEEPFNNLVLGGNQKNLVKALVEAHYDNDSTTGRSLSYARFDDFVQGKGQGLVVNLYGNPGVGKTLTAEAMSEHIHKPLIVIGASDLGVSAQSVENYLTWAFQMAARWRAIVLIDEADVFLESRALHDLTRNALVSVFLRHLEYFRGILFLTTNRVKTIDAAFQSRIHVSLRYRDLTADARRSIWVAFLTKARGTFTGEDEAALNRKLGPSASSPEFGHGLTEQELKQLSERDVNGRQIKNAVRTASALAASNGEVLSYAHLESVLDMMEDFKTEMSSTGQ